MKKLHQEYDSIENYILLQHIQFHQVFGLQLQAYFVTNQHILVHHLQLQNIH